MSKKPWLNKGDKVRFTSFLKYSYSDVYTVVEVDREGIGRYLVKLNKSVGWVDPSHLQLTESMQPEEEMIYPPPRESYMSEDEIRKEVRSRDRKAFFLAGVLTAYAVLVIVIVVLGFAQVL